MSNEKPKSEDEKNTENPGKKPQEDPPIEIGGYADMNKPEPTRYGDWETNGRCSDF